MADAFFGTGSRFLDEAPDDDPVPLIGKVDKQGVGGYFESSMVDRCSDAWMTG